MSLPSSAGTLFLTLTDKVNDLPTVLIASIILSEIVLFFFFLNLYYLHDISVVNRCSGSSPLRVSVEDIQWIGCRERMTFCSNLYYPMQKLNMKIQHRCFIMAKFNLSVMTGIHLSISGPLLSKIVWSIPSPWDAPQKLVLMPHCLVTFGDIQDLFVL